jgi:hypothetical protein
VGYDVHVLDQVARKAAIDAQKAASTSLERFVYRDRSENLKVVRVPLDFLIYRMANTRTEVEQLEYIQKGSLADDFFSAGEENQTAQKAQHGILLRMSKDEKGSIYKELEARREQIEPLLITSFGVVVNGNRRLAAMRDLFVSDQHAFKSFSHVDAKVLPEEADAIELELIETELQLIPETKLAYGWVESRMQVRHFRDDRGYSIEKIADLMRYSKPEDVNRRIGELELAEEYLDRYLRKPRAYKLVEKSEQVFHELDDRLERKTGDDAELSRHIGFMLIKESDKLGTRVYDLRDAFGKNSLTVVQRLARELGIDVSLEEVVGPSGGGSATDDPLEGITGPSPEYLEKMRDILTDPTRAADLAPRIVEIHREIKDEEKDSGVRGAALVRAEKAHRFLQEIDLSKSDVTKLGAIDAQLDSILTLATQLKEKIAKLARSTRGAKGGERRKGKK